MPTAVLTSVLALPSASPLVPPFFLTGTDPLLHPVEVESDGIHSPILGGYYIRVNCFPLCLPRGKTMAAQALLLGHYWQSINIGRMKKQFHDVCRQAGDFRSFSEVGRIQELKEAEAFACYVMYCNYLLLRVFPSIFELGADIVSSSIIYRKCGSALRNQFCPGSIIPKFQSLISHITVLFHRPHKNLVGPALLPIWKAPYNCTDTIHRVMIRQRQRNKLQSHSRPATHLRLAQKTNWWSNLDAKASTGLGDLQWTRALQFSQGGITVPLGC